MRFLYAGGLHELKGVSVLLRAAAQLHGIDGWELVTYGVPEKHVEATGIDLHGAPVSFRKPFEPEDRDEIIGAADAVVIPSIMRETHSILTREALSRGVPVVCTDTLGPEEVVISGVNGLVVPAGDVDLLADALRSLVEDHKLLTHLHEGCALAGGDPLTRRPGRRARAAHVRPCRRAAFGRRGATASRSRTGPCAGWCGPAASRARRCATGPGCRPRRSACSGVQTDVVHYRDPALAELVDGCDVLYVYRVPATRQFLDLVDRARSRGVVVIFDVDDLIFDPDIAPEIPALRILSPAEAEGWLYGVCRYRTTMEHCDGFVGSTPQLVRHAREVTGLPAAQFDNGVGILLARLSDRARAKRRQPGPIRLGYLSGTITHDNDWFYVEPAIVDTLDQHAEVELWLAGHLPHSPELERFGSRVRRIPFTPWMQLPALLHQIDVNLAPLEPDSRFNEAKSAIKWLEAALVATPTIASATEPFRDAIEQGTSGFTAHDLDDWRESLDLLVGDRRTRRLMGERARREALLRWSPHLQGRRFLDVLDEAQDWPAAAARRTRSDWVPAVADEPFQPSALDRYSVSNLAGAGRVPRPAAISRPLDRQAGPPQRARARVAATARQAVPYAGRRVVHGTRSKLVTARNGRAVELSRHTTRLLHDEGVARTTARAVRYTTNRTRSIGERLSVLPGVRHLVAALRRLRRSVDINGVGGTIDLARPVVRHRIVHSFHLAQLRVHILVRRTLQLVRPSANSGEKRAP